MAGRLSKKRPFRSRPQPPHSHYIDPGRVLPGLPRRAAGGKSPQRVADLPDEGRAYVEHVTTPDSLRERSGGSQTSSELAMARASALSDGTQVSVVYQTVNGTLCRLLQPPRKPAAMPLAGGGERGSISKTNSRN